MNAYLAHFAVYLCAMVGVIAVMLFIMYKVICPTFRSKTTEYLSVVESLNISPKKTLYIVKAGNKKLLIASDAERTTLLSELEHAEGETLADCVTSKLIDVTPINSGDRPKQPIMREILNKVRG